MCCGPEPESADPGHGVSARQLLRALVDTGAAQVMVLPNGTSRPPRNWWRAAPPAIGWGIDVVPVPAGSMVQGFAALAVHDVAVARPSTTDTRWRGPRPGAARFGRVATERALTWAGPWNPATAWHRRG